MVVNDQFPGPLIEANWLVRLPRDSSATTDGEKG